MSNISPTATIDKHGEVEIGEDVLISNHVKIINHHHDEDKYKWHRELEKNIKVSSLKIGDHAFIGYGAIILPNCTVIGENSIIGAGAVVTKDIPPNQVWAGNPAKKIRDREFVNGKDIKA